MGCDVTMTFDKGDIILERDDQRVVVGVDGSLEIKLLSDGTHITVASDGNVHIDAKDIGTSSQGS